MAPQQNYTKGGPTVAVHRRAHLQPQLQSTDQMLPSERRWSRRSRRPREWRTFHGVLVLVGVDACAQEAATRETAAVAARATRMRIAPVSWMLSLDCRVNRTGAARRQPCHTLYVRRAMADATPDVQNGDGGPQAGIAEPRGPCWKAGAADTAARRGYPGPGSGGQIGALKARFRARTSRRPIGTRK